jgi:hypothetical protein
MAKKLSFIIDADEGPAVSALSELTVALSKVNSSFRSINTAQRAASKNSTTGSKGIFDPKELNAVGAQLKVVNDGIKGIGTSNRQVERDSGFRGIAKGFDTVTNSASGLYKILGSLIPEISALTGAGVIGGLAAMGSAFGQRSTQVKTSQYETGFTPKSVFRLQNLGRAAGIDTDDTAKGLTQYSQTVRNIALNGDQATLGYLQNISGIKDIRGKYNDPLQREKLLQDLMKEAGRVSRSNPAAGFDLQNTLGLQWAEPLLMLSDKQRADADSAADKSFVPTNSQIDKGREEDLAKHRFGLSISSLTSRIGAHISPMLTSAFNGSSEFVDPKSKTGLFGPGLTDMAVDYLHSIFNKNSGIPDSNNQPGDPNSQDQSSIGIPISGNAPPEQSAKIIVQFDNAPRGMKATVSPDSTARVQPQINYSGSGFQ